VRVDVRGVMGVGGCSGIVKEGAEEEGRSEDYE